MSNDATNAPPGPTINGVPVVPLEDKYVLPGYCEGVAKLYIRYWSNVIDLGGFGKCRNWMVLPRNPNIRVTGAKAPHGKAQLSALEDWYANAWISSDPCWDAPQRVETLLDKWIANGPFRDWGLTN